MSRHNHRHERHDRRGNKQGSFAFGVTFLLFILFFHGFGLGRIILGLIVAGVVAKIIRTMASGLDLTTHNRQDEQNTQDTHTADTAPRASSTQTAKPAQKANPDPLQKVAKDTGNPEVDTLLSKGRAMIVQIRSENEKIPDEGLTSKLTRLETLCADIFRAVYEKPAKASQIRKFMDYYLPTTLKMVKAYRKLGENNVSGADADAARARIDDALGIVVQGCQKLLNNLYKDDMLDITTDIDVLEQMLKRDGLTESDLQIAAQQARQAAAINDQVEKAAQEKTYDSAQWHAGQQTDVARQVQDAVQQAQAHKSQAPVMQMYGQATQKQE